MKLEPLIAIDTSKNSNYSGPLLCVILYVLFGGGYLISIMSLLRRNFNVVLNIMIAHYIKKLIHKRLRHFGFIWCDVRISLFENNICKILLEKKKLIIETLYEN